MPGLSLCRNMYSQQGSQSTGGVGPVRDYSRPRQVPMQRPEPGRFSDANAKKKLFIEQKRAEEEARRRGETHHASAEPYKVLVQVCSASP